MRQYDLIKLSQLSQFELTNEIKFKVSDAETRFHANTQGSSTLTFP